MDSQNAPSVLIVDDDAALLRFVTRYVHRLGYRVTACASAEEAWKLFHGEPVAFGLLMIDVSAHQHAGQDLVPRMLKLNPRLRVLFWSGYLFDVESLPVTPPKAEFIHKPFTPSTLRKAVERLLTLEAGAGSP